MFQEDTSTFFDIDAGFAQFALIDGASVAVIFDKEYGLGNVGMLGMASTQPALTLSTADVPANPVGLSVEIDGGTYQVATHEPDGTGISRLVLEATA